MTSLSNVGINMEFSDLDLLYQRLIDSYIKHRKIKNKDDLETKLVFDLITMTSNNRQKILLESSAVVDPSKSDQYTKDGIIQEIPYSNESNTKKYTLTYYGIAFYLKTKGFDLASEYTKLLLLLDKKHSFTQTNVFKWEEKIGTIGLLLLGCTSNTSALSLDNDTNKTVWRDLLNELIQLFKDCALIEADATLSSPKRGETPESALMSRLNDLQKKTSQYYKSHDATYYFDIEKENRVEEDKVSFLLKKVFDQPSLFENKKDFLSNKLQMLSQRYYAKLNRKNLNSENIFIILSKLKMFFTYGS